MFGGGANSISISAISSSFLMNVRASSARPRRGGWPPKPRHMAHRIVDLPVPLGPMTTLSLWRVVYCHIILLFLENIKIVERDFEKTFLKIENSSTKAFFFFVEVEIIIIIEIIMEMYALFHSSTDLTYRGPGLNSTSA